MVRKYVACAIVNSCSDLILLSYKDCVVTELSTLLFMNQFNSRQTRKDPTKKRPTIIMLRAFCKHVKLTCNDKNEALLVHCKLPICVILLLRIRTGFQRSMQACFSCLSEGPSLISLLYASSAKYKTHPFRGLHSCINSIQ